MGIIDSNKFTVTCDGCGISEDAAVHEKGSAYGASWQDGPEMKHFDVVWNGKGPVGPVIETAKCKKCGVPAVVKSLV